MLMKSNIIVCFGEILLDLFPDGKKLWGAPFNVASSLKGLNANVQFISRIGNDSLGRELHEKVQTHGISTEYLQIDSVHKTGDVQVSIDSIGSAKYEISKNVAWDFIEALPETIKLVSNSSAFIFGSLIARGKSFEALKSFLKISKFCVFDLNLRPPFFSKSLIIQLMNQSDMLKFNDDELYQIASIIESSFDSIEKHIEFIAKQTNTDIICVTKGMNGAVLYYKGDWFYNNGYKVEVVDTVGAGDSFLATLVNGIIKNEPLQETIDYACAMGAIVANSPGANPSINMRELKSFIENSLEN